VSPALKERSYGGAFVMSHCDIASGWLVSPAAGQINSMSLPNRVGRNMSGTTLLREDVKCRGVCQRVFI
jgi:hypothetical protein